MAEKRTRRRRFKFDESKLVKRALKFENDDEQARTLEMDARLHRDAKFRQWTTDDVE